MYKRQLLAASLFISTQVAANALDDAVHAMRAGDFAEAYCIMRPLADKGDADAQYNIGWMYLNGYGLRVNDSLALEWWKKAERQGHPDASFSIGMLYSLGEGEVPRDMQLAVDHYMKAVAEGQEDAIAIISSMIVRNDKAIRPRLHQIVDNYAELFGEYRRVKANKLNARQGPSVEQKIVAQLLQGQVVLEVFRQGKWSQVVMLENKDYDKTVWVYNPLLEPAE